MASGMTGDTAGTNKGSRTCNPDWPLRTWVGVKTVSANIHAQVDVQLLGSQKQDQSKVSSLMIAVLSFENSPDFDWFILLAKKGC